jgi:hypothetical protein
MECERHAHDMSADALGSQRPEAGTHDYHAGRANSLPDLPVEKGFDEVRAAVGRELHQSEHHREKQSGEEPKSQARKRSLVDVEVGYHGAPWRLARRCSVSGPLH